MRVASNTNILLFNNKLIDHDIKSYKKTTLSTLIKTLLLIYYIV